MYSPIRPFMPLRDHTCLFFQTKNVMAFSFMVAMPSTELTNYSLATSNLVYNVHLDISNRQHR